MEIKEIKLKVTIYNYATIFDKYYIILNKGKNKYLTFNVLINKIYEFGEKLLANLPDDFFATQELSLFQYEIIINLFLEFFNKEEFIFCDYVYSHTSSTLKNKSLKLISKADIISMCTKIIKIYNYQKYYEQTVSKNYNVYINQIKDKLFGELHTELEKYCLETKDSKIELEYFKQNKDCVDTISSFCLVFNDWYAFALYNMIYNCFDIDRNRFVKCIICGKMAIKTNNRQQRCPECSQENKKYNPQKYLENK